MRATAVSSERNSRVLSWVILLFIFLVRIPFLVIHHVQEDAYITFRTARHIAEQGDFSYNLHQHFPATTSLLYPFIVAAIDLVLHRWMVPGVQLLGTACVALASYLAARSLCQDTGERRAAWVLLACWPVSLLVSYTGMETPLLLLALGMAMYAFRQPDRAALFAGSMLLLPLIRPEAAAYGIVFCAAMFFVARRVAWLGSAALAAGTGLLLLGNRIATGAFLPTTMRAKEIAYHPSHSFTAVLDRVQEIFFHQSFLLPVSTSYLTRLSPLLLLFAVVIFVVAFRKSGERRERMLLCALATLVIAVPIAYAAGGVIFDWYLYPANWLTMVVFVTVLVRRLGIGCDGLAWACRSAVDTFAGRVDTGLSLPWRYRPVSGRAQSWTGDVVSGARRIYPVLRRLIYRRRSGSGFRSHYQLHAQGSAPCRWQLVDCLRRS
jgi:hypothetical protein